MSAALEDWDPLAALAQPTPAALAALEAAEARTRADKRRFYPPAVKELPEDLQDLANDALQEDWAPGALCAQADPELWFPEGGTQRQAKALCRTCPVVDLCRAMALLTDQRFGIWGGLSQKERQAVRRAGTQSIATSIREGQGIALRNAALEDLPATCAPANPQVTPPATPSPPAADAPGGTTSDIAA